MRKVMHVILSEAKDVLLRPKADRFAESTLSGEKQILRFAQDDTAKGSE